MHLIFYGFAIFDIRICSKKMKKKKNKPKNLNQIFTARGNVYFIGPMSISRYECFVQNKSANKYFNL